MSWLRDAWDYATYRTPAHSPTLWWWGVPGADFAGWPISAAFGPTLATRYPAEVKVLGLLAVRVSPLEFLDLLAARDAAEVRGSDRRDGRAAVAAAG
jgi:hypothetical protein